MQFRLLSIILVSLFVSSCAQGPYAASTPFIVSDNLVDKAVVSVGVRQPFFQHQIQYQDQVILDGEFADNPKDKSRLKSGTRLFSIDVRLETMPGESLNGIIDQKFYCGLKSKQSGLNKILMRASGGDDLRCFRDSNQDGSFETAYVAIGAMKDPLSVYVVKRKAIALASPIPYRKVQNSEKDNVGQVWFQVREPSTRSLFKDNVQVVDLYIGGEGEKSTLATFSLEQIHKGLPLIFTLGGAKIELISIENTKVTLKLLSPIAVDHKFAIVKTVMTTVY